MRTWRLCQILHGPPGSWEHMPAWELDRLLAVDEAIKKGQANVNAKGA